MARSVRAARLETRTARLKLGIGVRHWKTIGKGFSLAYRRTVDGYGTWQARLFDSKKGYSFQALGRADDFQEANGIDVLDFIQAQAKARELASREARKRAGLYHEPLTVNEATTRYLVWFKENRRSYRDTAFNVNAHILPAFGEKLVAELRTREIREWHEKLATVPPRKRTPMGQGPAYHEKPKTAHDKRSRKSTANRILTVFKAILNRAFRDELVADDEAWRRVKPFGNVDEPLVRFLSEAEAVRLINSCRADYRNLVKAALFTGARYGELTRLLVADVNLDTASMFIRPSKSGRGRHIPLHAEGCGFFRELIAGKCGDSRVFLREDGDPWGKAHCTRPMREACESAKIVPAIGFHELRHSYASFLAQRGVDLLTISKLLGHADTRITSKHYAHLCDKTLSDAVVAHLPGFGHVSSQKVVSLKQ